MVIWHEHTALSARPLVLARNLVKFGALGTRVGRIVCPTADLARQLRRRGARRGLVTVVPNGIDPARFAPAGLERQRSERSALGLPDEAPVLLHFGWNWELKGGALFLATLQAVRSAGLDAVGIFVHGGAEARAEATRLGLDGALRVLGPVDDVTGLFAAADVLVASSRAEGGVPFAVLESLSSGVPVAATDLSGHALLGDAVPSCRIAPHDPLELAAAIRALLDRDPERATAEAIEAREWASRNLSLERWCERILEVFDGVIGL